MKKIVLPLMVVSLAGLSACAPAVVGGAGMMAGMAATREGGFRAAYDDAKIRVQINDLWFRYNVEMFRKLDLTVDQGRVLITGVVQNPEDRVEAVRLAWQADGVKQVINEVRVAESEGIQGYIRDTWITTRLRAAMTIDSIVQNLNYSIDTVQGTVYLMGIANSQAELNRVLELARTIPYVKRVVSYVKLVGEPVVPPGQAGGVSAGGGRSSAPASAPGGDSSGGNGYSGNPYNGDSYNGNSAQQAAPPGTAAVAPVQREQL